MPGTILQTTTTTTKSYLSPAEHDLSFFPQLPVLTGKGMYAADQLLKPTREIPAEKFPMVIPLFCKGYSQSRSYLATMHEHHIQMQCFSSFDDTGELNHV